MGESTYDITKLLHLLDTMIVGAKCLRNVSVQLFYEHFKQQFYPADITPPGDVDMKDSYKESNKEIEMVNFDTERADTTNRASTFGKQVEAGSEHKDQMHPIASVNPADQPPTADTSTPPTNQIWVNSEKDKSQIDSATKNNE